FLGHSTVALHDLRSVAGKVAHQNLKDTSRIFERWIRFESSSILRLSAPILRMPTFNFLMTRCVLAAAFLWRTLVKPTFRIVFLVLRIPAREQPIEIFGITEVIAQKRGRIRIVRHILPEFLLVL